MNLAFCLFNYFPYGGLQRDFLRIAQECLHRGHTIDVYTMRWDGDKDPALPVILLPTKGWQNHKRRKNFADSLKTALTKKSYDLVIGFNKMPGLDVYYAADTCFQAKARQQHKAWYRFTPRYQQSIAFEHAVFSEQSSTEILLIAPQQQAEFTKFYHTPSRRFHVLPPGIAHDRIAPDDAANIRETVRHEFSLRDNTFLLLMVGSGFKTKGLDRILLGLAHLPTHLKNRTELFVIGKDRTAAFEKQAHRLGIQQRVKFLGARDDVPRFLLSADLLLHPAYNENTGTVLLEALVAGLPVLTTDVCGYAHYVQTANAGRVLSSPFQQTEFDATLIDMLLSSEHVMWKNNALSFAQQADIYDMPKHAVNFIESLRR